MAPKLSRSQRLMVIIGISFSFFVAEISVGFYTRSLALVADAFHYMNDLIGFIVALAALKISQRNKSPKELSFGWQRAQLLGAFFNGVFLLALGVSIFLQSLERFVSLQRVENPKLILIMGCVGLTLNIISAIFLHEHDEPSGHNNAGGGPDTNTTELLQLDNAAHAHEDHRHKVTPSKLNGHDLGMMGVLIHVIGDAVNNVGVIIAALVIWRAKFDGRYYADPGVSMGIALLILLSSLPLGKLQSGLRIFHAAYRSLFQSRTAALFLLESVPLGVSLDDIRHDLEKIPGVTSLHELHVWRLSQNKAIASAHVVTSESAVTKFMDQARLINECLHAYGIHSVTLQPELLTALWLPDNLWHCLRSTDLLWVKGSHESSLPAFGFSGWSFAEVFDHVKYDFYHWMVVIHAVVFILPLCK